MKKITIVSSRDPKLNKNINPLKNWTINPNTHYILNPNKNYNINPKVNDRLNPDKNYSINPKTNWKINPEKNFSINPEYNKNINPLFTLSISPFYNTNINGYYYFNIKHKFIGCLIEADNNVMFLYNKNLQIETMWIKRENGYCIFDACLNEVGFAESNGNQLFNIFDKDNVWIGYLT